jgi:hypothetical protein
VAGWRFARFWEAMMAPDELERRVDRALRRLTPPRAPRSLAPRVMQAIAAGSQAVVAAGGGWRYWPRGRQVLVLAGACWTAATMALALPVAARWLAEIAVTRAAVALWQTFVAPIAAPAIAVVAVMCAASALLVAALKYVAWERRWTLHS